MENNIEESNLKIGFFRKLWYSIQKIEKYSELAAEGVASAIKYLIILVLMMAIVSATLSIYKISNKVKEVSDFIRNQDVEISYKEGILDVNSENPIESDLQIGKIIIDTKTEENEKIDNYLSSDSESNVIVVLKNKLILKEQSVESSVNYSYVDLFGEMGITEFNKDQLLSYLSGDGILKLYSGIAIGLIFYTFVIYFINTMLNIIIIASVACVAALILKMKPKVSMMFNMGVYAVTLSTILNMLYIILNSLTGFKIVYFDVMYTVIASIYIIAAVFIMKSDLIKKQGEVQKIVEVEKELKEEKEEENVEVKKEKKKKEKSEKKEESEEDTKEDGAEGAKA